MPPPDLSLTRSAQGGGIAHSGIVMEPWPSGPLSPIETPLNYLDPSAGSTLWHPGLDTWGNRQLPQAPPGSSNPFNFQGPGLTPNPGAFATPGSSQPSSVPGTQATSQTNYVSPLGNYNFRNQPQNPFSMGNNFSPFVGGQGTTASAQNQYLSPLGYYGGPAGGTGFYQ